MGRFIMQDHSGIKKIIHFSLLYLMRRFFDFFFFFHGLVLGIKKPIKIYKIFDYGRFDYYKKFFLNIFVCPRMVYYVLLLLKTLACVNLIPPLTVQSNAIKLSYNSSFTKSILWNSWRNKQLAIYEICNDIIKIDLRCCSYIWDVAVSLYRVYLNESTVNPQFKWFYCIMHVQNMGFTFLIMVPFPSVS